MGLYVAVSAIKLAAALSRSATVMSTRNGWTFSLCSQLKPYLLELWGCWGLSLLLPRAGVILEWSQFLPGLLVGMPAKVGGSCRGTVSWAQDTSKVGTVSAGSCKRLAIEAGGGQEK